jgi:hypothetical protein
MPVIHEELIVHCTKDTAFGELASTGFMKKIDPNYGLDTRILFQNERLIRSVSRVAGIGEVEIERLMVPEVGAIITQRRPPLGPFVYQLSIQAIREHPDGCLLEWTNEFELTEESRAREAVIYSRIQDNDRANLQRTQAALERGR